MTNSPHFFIGISINEELKSEFFNWQSFLKKELESNYRVWTDRKDLHLTLKFLGEVDANQLAALKHSLRELDDFPSFLLKFKGIGTFGKPRKPRVLWVGVEDNPVLEKLKREVEEQCRKAGLPEDRQPYRPHITLAKKWQGEKLSTEKLAPFTRDLDKEKEMRVTDLSLFQIHPSKQQKYEEIMKIEWK